MIAKGLIRQLAADRVASLKGAALVVAGGALCMGTRLGNYLTQH